MAKENSRIAILISGRGSNMQSIVSECKRGSIPADVVLVVSNKPKAAGLKWAQDQGIDTRVLRHKDYENREAHDKAIVNELKAAKVDWVCLAGYMRLLSKVFIDAFPNRILNIHPSILPAFPGLNAQEQAFNHGVRISGCTVHLVDLELDHGPIVAQRSVAVELNDTADILAERILKQEHKLYPEAIRTVLERSWKIKDRRIEWS